jgi:hypothetical protein
MKTTTYTQAEAKGFFDANTKPIVIEYVLPDMEEPLEVSGSRGKPISNGSALKRLDQLADPQKYLFDNYDSRKKELRCGFTRWVPAGRENDVLFRITICETKAQAKVISKLYRDTKLTVGRTMRRDVEAPANKHLRLFQNTSVVVDAGTATNVAIKAA